MSHTQKHLPAEVIRQRVSHLKQALHALSSFFDQPDHLPPTEQLRQHLESATKDLTAIHQLSVSYNGAVPPRTGGNTSDPKPQDELPEVDSADRKRDDFSVSPAPELLSFSASLYQPMADISSDGWCLVLDGEIHYANPAAANLWGAAHPQLLLGTSFWNNVRPDCIEQVQRYAQRVMQESAMGPVTATFLRSDGSAREADISGIPVSFQAQPALLFCLRDRTVHLLEEMRAVNERLRTSEQFSKQVMSSVHEGVAVFDKEFRYLAWNSFLESRTGLSATQVIGKRPSEVFNPAILEQFDLSGKLERALAGELVIIEDTFAPLSPTNSSWITACFSPLKNDQQEIIGVICTVSPVTELKIAEHSLLEQKNLLRAFYDTAHVRMCVHQLIDNDFIYKLPNQHMAAFLGLTVEELTGKTATEAGLSPEQKAYWYHLLKTCSETGTTTRMEYAFPRPDGTDGWHFASFSPIPGGNDIAFAGTDITDRKKADEKIAELLRDSQDANTRLLASEEELRQLLENTLELNERLHESEQRWQFALEGNRDGVWDWNLQNDQVYFSNRFKEILGYRPEEKMVGVSQWESKIHPDDKESVFEALARHIKGETEIYQTEYRALGQGNEYVWVLGRGIVIGKDQHGQPLRLIGTISDITQRKQHEQAMAYSTSYLNKLINTIIDPVFVKDRHHRWVLVNESWCHFHQLTRERMLGKSDYEFFRKEEADVFWEGDEQVFTTGEDYVKEEHMTNGSGKVRTIITKKSLYYDASGQPFIVGIFVDISDRKQIEEKLKQQNENLQKINAELDSFVYRTSHDLRAPLASVLGLISISRLEEDAGKKAEYLDLMENRITKLDNFIHDIINYSRNARMDIVLEEVDLASLIQETLAGLTFMPGFDTIEKDIHIEQPTSFVSDGFRLKIISDNLISNAIKYQSSFVDRSYIRIRVQVNEQRAILRFEDNGIGIRQESLDKIFQMFYRASEVSTGSGLGLYIVKDVVEALKGSISVQSQPGQGTSFTVEIPNVTAR